MVSPLTPKPTRKAEALARAPPTIVSCRKEDVALKEVAKPRLCCANGKFETKTKDGSTAAKAPAPRTNPNTKEAPTAPKPHTHPSHERDEQARNPGAMTAPPTPKPTRKAETLAMAPPTTVSRREEDAALKEVAKPRLCCANGIFETKGIYAPHIYCKYSIYWQASNTAVHYAFISRGRGPPPDLFPLTGGEPPDRHDFFF